MLLLILGNPRIVRSTDLPTGPEQASGSVALADPIAVLLAQNRKVRAVEKVYLATVEQIKVAGTLPDPMVESSLFLQPVETKVGPMEAQVMVGQ